ncbi:putative RNA binding protein [Namao virus]|nr:putative RNA binding protein [Namao virus]
MSSPVLFIYNIAKNTLESDLYEVFGSFGNILSSAIFTIKKYALIQFDNEQSASNLIYYSRYYNIYVLSQKIQICYSKSKNIYLTCSNKSIVHNVSNIICLHLYHCDFTIRARDLYDMFIMFGPIKKIVLKYVSYYVALIEFFSKFDAQKTKCYLEKFYTQLYFGNVGVTYVDIIKELDVLENDEFHYDVTKVMVSDVLDQKGTVCVYNIPQCIFIKNIFNLFVLYGYIEKISIDVKSSARCGIIVMKRLIDAENIYTHFKDLCLFGCKITTEILSEKPTSSRFCKMFKKYYIEKHFIVNKHTIQKPSCVLQFENAPQNISLDIFKHICNLLYIPHPVCCYILEHKDGKVSGRLTWPSIDNASEALCFINNYMYKPKKSKTYYLLKFCYYYF